MDIEDYFHVVSLSSWLKKGGKNPLCQTPEPAGCKEAAAYKFHFLPFKA